MPQGEFLDLKTEEERENETLNFLYRRSHSGAVRGNR
jgi:hypothetical protein